MEKIIFDDLKFCLSIMDKANSIIIDTLEEKTPYDVSIIQLNILINIMEDFKKSCSGDSFILDNVINYIDNVITYMKQGKKTIVRLYL